jgi:monoamine oxidase
MRFLTSHRRVASLVAHLRLDTRELPVQDPGGRSLFYLRGRHFTAADWGEPRFVPPYLLDRGERSRSPGQLLIEIALRHRDRAQHLRDVGFRSLMLDELSLEAYQLIRDASGYDTLVNDWSAAEAIPFLLADFDPSLEYRALRRGFQALPLMLADRFTAAGGEVFRHHRLCRLDRNGGGGVRLTFDLAEGGSDNPRRVAKPLSCVASHVILALPRRSIELLHPDSLLFDGRQFGEDLETVIPQPGFKIFTAYRRPWWLDTREVTAGRSVTDLPVRQCYYWHSVPASERASRNSLLMASYSDGGSVEFWAGLARHPERYRPPVTACPPGIGIPDPEPGLSASAAMVAELQDQLRELHGLSTLSAPDSAQIVPPYAAYYRDWTSEPYGGGWHFWRIGARAQAIMERMRHPSPGDPVYVCGEAWSRQQGWVEGALESADLLLEHVLRLPPPAWDAAPRSP